MFIRETIKVVDSLEITNSERTKLYETNAKNLLKHR